jgi:DNA-directed RNA polymerase, mitochondrial
MDGLEGGFVIHKTQAILSGYHRHTTALAGQPVSAFDLEATNRLQGTAETVNRRVLHVAQELLAKGVPTPLVPASTMLPVPGRKPDAEWAAMDDAARKAHKAAIARVHAENASRTGQFAGFVEALDTAREMESFPAFWFPWTHDFRLRRYPVACGGLSPQGSDLAKNLMMFARGKPLGSSGFYWLCVRLANAMGQDKLPTDDRVGWTLDRFNTWNEIAHDPVRHVGLWEHADSPWEALATIFELDDAGAHPEDFVSHLAVPMDGSCNGLQHLSAMGLDPVGAFATNLTACDQRQDVYLQVMEHCIRRVETDAARGIPEALLWLGRIGRDTVKRAVLATPYGVTDAGIQKQLLDDKKVPQSDTVSAKDASAYFRDVLVGALSGTVVAAKQIMGWLQACGMRLAEAGLPMTWETPTGSTIQQAYRSHAGRQIRTLVGKIQLSDEVDDGLLNPRKQALGSAPNVVHSFDAAHLARTVNALGRRYGIEDFAMVHDSFGVHACDTATMHAVLRREFVDMYAANWLERLHAGFRASAPHVELPDPPARGSFDVSQVMDARFFFA